MNKILTVTIKVIAALAILIIALGFAEVNNALHPPRIIPPGNTLREARLNSNNLT